MSHISSPLRGIVEASQRPVSTMKTPQELTDKESLLSQGHQRRAAACPLAQGQSSWPLWRPAGQEGRRAGGENYPMLTYTLHLMHYKES